ncbi:MAG: NAD(P)H-binding protein [Bacillota bacterium]
MSKFGFIVHPLQLKDMERKYPFIRWIPDFIVEKIVKVLPPLQVAKVTGLMSPTGSQAEGWLVGCPLTSKQLLTMEPQRALTQIIKAAKKAQELGAEIVGLGAYTSIIGDKGITVAKELDIPVTTGNTYTIVTAIEAVYYAARECEINLSSSNLVVVGATGSIGRAVVKILAAEFREVILVAREELKLQQLTTTLNAVHKKVKITYTLNLSSALSRGDIVITVSSALESIINPTDLKKGSLVCDIARPRDVAQAVDKLRDDVLVIEGGLVKVPGRMELNFDLGLAPQTVYACMAETMILALEGKYDSFTLGSEISLTKVKLIQHLAVKHGFNLADLRHVAEVDSTSTLRS